MRPLPGGQPYLQALRARCGSESIQDPAVGTKRQKLEPAGLGSECNGACDRLGQKRTVVAGDSDGTRNGRDQDVMGVRQGLVVDAAERDDGLVGVELERCVAELKGLAADPATDGLGPGNRDYPGTLLIGLWS